jgi:hypothetical protein
VAAVDAAAVAPVVVIADTPINRNS